MIMIKVTPRGNTKENSTEKIPELIDQKGIIHANCLIGCPSGAPKATMLLLM